MTAAPMDSAAHTAMRSDGARRGKTRSFVTPEGVDLSLEIASAGLRFGGLLIDLVLMVLILIGFTLLIGFGIGATGFTGTAAIVWLLLDLRWLDDLLAKHAVTEEVYAGRPWAERVALQPDEATLAATRQIAGIAAEMHAGRVLVHADSPYTMLRMIYFLLPLNVAPLQLALSEAPATSLPRDALIAVFDSEWKYDENSRRLGNDTTGISVEPLYASKGLRIFRVDGRAP